MAFGDALSVIWKTMTGILAIGLLASLFMQDVPLHSEVDKKWEEPTVDKLGAVESGEKRRSVTCDSRTTSKEPCDKSTDTCAVL